MVFQALLRGLRSMQHKADYATEAAKSLRRKVFRFGALDDVPFYRIRAAFY